MRERIVQLFVECLLGLLFMGVLVGGIALFMCYPIASIIGALVLLLVVCCWLYNKVKGSPTEDTDGHE